MKKYAQKNLSTIMLKLIAFKNNEDIHLKYNNDQYLFRYNLNFISSINLKPEEAKEIEYILNDEICKIIKNKFKLNEI